MLQTPSLSKRMVYAPVGRCIYCGADEGTLTDEHPLPDGLGGRHILPKASCEACQKIINGFEQYCMRTLLHNARSYFRVKSTKKRPALPTTITVIKPGGERQEVSGDARDLPLIIALPAFPTPTILLDRPPTRRFKGGSWTPQPVNFRAQLEKLGAVAVETKDVNAGKLARMLAKIAHAQTVALMGIDSFKPLLLDIILGKKDMFIELVGGDLNRHEADRTHVNNLHVGYCRRPSDGKIFLLAQIRLFANLGAPVYYVVVGEPNEKALSVAPLPASEDWRHILDTTDDTPLAVLPKGGLPPPKFQAAP